jgi:hypothetical protein
MDRFVLIMSLKKTVSQKYFFRIQPLYSNLYQQSAPPYPALRKNQTKKTPAAISNPPSIMSVRAAAASSGTFAYTEIPYAPSALTNTPLKMTIQPANLRNFSIIVRLSQKNFRAFGSAARIISEYR